MDTYFRKTRRPRFDRDIVNKPAKVPASPIRRTVLEFKDNTPKSQDDTEVASSPPKAVRRVLDFKELGPEPEDKKIASGPLRGVSAKLLDIIREKEAKSASQTPDLIRKRELLDIAPRLARIIYTIYTANKREVILYNTIIEKCSKCLKNNYTASTIIECLDFTLEVAPDWVSIIEISKGKFIRLNKTQYSLSQMLKAIERYKIR